MNTYIKQYKKYSIFHNGSKFVPAATVFKGIQLNMSRVENVIRDTNSNIQNIIVNNSVNNFNEYRCSIILNTVYQGYAGCTISSIPSGYTYETFPYRHNRAKIYTEGEALFKPIAYVYSESEMNSGITYGTSGNTFLYDYYEGTAPL